MSDTMTGMLFSVTRGGVTASDAARVEPDVQVFDELEPLPRLAGNPEEDAKDAALDAVARKHRALVAELRSRMKRLYLKRKAHQGADAYVTADDARVILDADPEVSSGLNKNFMGSLFRCKAWEPTGKQIKSKTPGSHANRILCWRWVGEEM